MKTEIKTINDRIREVREKAGLSRPTLAEKTGIPKRSVEKLEYGSMEPSIDRLKAIAKACDASFDYLVSGDTDQDNSKPSKPKSTSDDKPETVKPKSEELSIEQQLIKIDAMRKSEFEGNIRAHLADINQVAENMKRLEPGDLHQLAINRGIPEVSFPSIDHIYDMFSSDVDGAQAICTDLEERVMDTAIIGFDFVSQEHVFLSEIVEEAEIQRSDEEEKDFVDEIFSLFTFDLDEDEDRERLLAMASDIRKWLRSRAFSGEFYEVN